MARNCSCAECQILSAEICMFFCQSPNFVGLFTSLRHRLLKAYCSQVNRVANSYSSENIKTFRQSNIPLPNCFCNQLFLSDLQILFQVFRLLAFTFVLLCLLFRSDASFFRALRTNFRGQHINFCSRVIHNSKILNKSEVFIRSLALFADC